jgi:hypothetical protein
MWSTPGPLLLVKLMLLSGLAIVMLLLFGVLKWSEIRVALTALAMDRASSS